MTDGSPLSVLERVRGSGATSPSALRCDLCGEPIEEDHSHAVDTHERRLLCTCRPCYLLFTSPGAAGGRRRAVPSSYRRLEGFSLGPGGWDALEIPVGVAFFLRDPEGRVTAFYPGPAGATESLLPLGAWDQVVEANPDLGDLDAEVEAALVTASGERGPSCFVVPVDACYELVGRLRRVWRGFDGGQDARRELADFLGHLTRRADGVGRGAS